MERRLPSVKTLVSIAAIAPLLAISLALFVIASFTSRRIEARLSGNLVESTTSSVQNRLVDTLRDTQWISDLYAYRVTSGVLPEHTSPDWDAWDRLLYGSIAFRDSWSSISYTNPTGNATIALRSNDKLIIAEVQGNARDATTFYVVDSHGEPVPASEWRGTYDAIAQSNYTKAINSKSPAWIPVTSTILAAANLPVSNRPGFSYTRAIRRADESVIGVITTNISLKAVQSLLESSDIADGGSLILLDGSDRILAAAGRVTVDDHQLQDLSKLEGKEVDVLRAAMVQVRNRDQVQLLRDDRYVSVTPIRPFPGINWRLAAVMPRSMINEETSTLQTFMMLAGLACVALALLIGLRLSGWIVRPVQELVSAVRKIGQGEFRQTLPHQHGAELAELTTALSEMSGQLAKQVELRAEMESLERASAAKSQFFSRVTHELRTPLNSIIGYAEMIAERPSTQNDPVAADDVRKVLQSSQHLLALITDLLDTARIEAGREKVDWEMVPIEPLVNEVREIVAPLVATNHNQLEIDIQPSLTVHTDARKLKLILINLLSNAAKFTERGVILLSAHADGSRVQITVKDTGVGIEPGKINAMFEPFTRGPGTVHGTGLGLSIVRQLTRLIGGDLDVQSKPGHGTSVDLYLPLITEKLRPREDFSSASNEAVI